MTTLESIETTHDTEHPSRRWTTVVVVAVIVAAVAAVGVWALTQDNEPVAAEEARVELTFTGEEASFEGDREIVAGTGDVVFVNDGSVSAWLVVQYFEPGSNVLEDDLAEYPEGTDFVTSDMPSGEAVIMQAYAPGRTTERLEFEPGTYVIEAAMANPGSTHVWRAAVIDVVAG